MSTINGESSRETDTSLVHCPNSFERGNLMTNFKIHYASPEELKKYAGVCRQCFEKFASRNRTLDGSETPAEFLNHHPRPDSELDHLAFSKDGQIEQTTDFDFAAVEALDTDTKEFFDSVDRDSLTLAGTALGMILRWVWSSGFATAQRRFAVVSAGLRPELLNDQSWREIGKQLGCTRAALSKSAVLFQAVFQVQFSRSRSETARQRMSNSMLGNSNRKAGTHNQMLKS
jgi:hypothetical protein